MNTQDSFITPAPPIPPHDKPTNRLREVGLQGLTISELLAILIGSQDLTTAHLLLHDYPTYYDLSKALDTDLLAIPGIGPQAANRITAALELSRRWYTQTPQERWQIRAPSDAYTIARAAIADPSVEHFLVINLDTRNRLVKLQTLYTGTVNTSFIRAAEIFRYAISHNCPAIALAHNHPSGDPAPSPEDVAVTRRLVDAAQLLEITILDHIIIGDGTYTSLRERSLGFDNEKSTNTLNLH